ncbi:TniB family NTP-binding protein [Actinoplanes hulinensis]|uniref:TniB family NTP-binding protein n=1 Tax=Actinoplanes hulinensis TaxID=1144547 RepID=A0ABS7B3E0_9ACTN|nr:TniB family NTP-binding protein [Actinoplanes hulinensis]MBW6434934.1 TniB family NTP-binding protein [Actinoplanes hulinensis]
MTGGALYTLSRKEGWRRWADAPSRERPEPLTPRQLAVLGQDAKADYDDARHDWHANFGTINTPQLAAIHEELDQIVATNRQDPDRVRGAAVIDALPGLGKTTIANTFARDYDRTQRRRHGERTDDGHERLPVFRVGLTSRTTLRTLNRMICEFYGHPGTDRASAAQLATFAVDCVLSCHTRIGIIDDLHFIDPNRRDGVDVSNHLKWLANELPVTFIYAGVGLADRRLFAEGLTGDSAIMAQIARRWTRLELPPFQIGDATGRRRWRSLLKATERQLVLAKAHPGMLAGLDDYLFARTTGHIGSFITLITRGCYKAIRTGAEVLTESLLDTVRIDEASETARHQLQAAITADRRPRRQATTESR